jgi:hypothetical protein
MRNYCESPSSNRGLCPAFLLALLCPDKRKKYALTGDGSGRRVKRGAQGGAQDLDRGYDYHSNQGHQQAVFHGGGPGLIPKKSFEHLFLLSPQGKSVFAQQ